MLKLQVADTNATTGSIPISWCIEGDTVSKINPAYKNVIIFVTPEDDSSSSYFIVANLFDMMTYLPLKVKGKNRIFGVIATDHEVRMTHWNHSRIHYKDLNAPEYQETDIGFDEQYTYFCDSYILIDVPDACFAKNPNKYEAAWVNAMFRYLPENQCEFRRRRLWAYSVQPFITVLLLLVRIIFFLFAFFFGYKLHWKEVYKLLTSPFSMDLEDCTNAVDEHIVNKWYHVFLMPIVSVPIIFVLIGIYMGTIVITGSILLNYIVVPLLAVIFVVFLWLGLFAISKRFSLKKKDSEDPEDIELLICTGEPLATSIKDLPKNKRTIKLKYLALKNKVCKPYSK